MPVTASQLEQTAASVEALLLEMEKDRGSQKEIRHWLHLAEAKAYKVLGIVNNHDGRNKS